MLMLFLLAGCASSLTEEVELPKEKPVLKIYLFAPSSPIITRGNEGDVRASEEEKRISTLDVWVFEHNDAHTPVGYIHLTNQTFEGQKEITMEISDDFAVKNPRPYVDIYVAANVTSSNCGVTLTRDMTPAQLEDVGIGEGYFGVISKVSSVPIDGLPMSGISDKEKGMPVTGEAPVLSAKADNIILVRAVSKIRFILSKSTSNPPEITDLSISLDQGVIPTKEYIFLKGPYPGANCYVSTGSYKEEATLVTGINGSDIASCASPAKYLFGEETGQAYESRIDAGLTEQTVEGVTKPAELSEVGRFYLRESDQKLKGKISYRLGGSLKTAVFEMSSVGDFTRNHTWIVYGYFLGNGNLVLNAVDVKDWDDDEDIGETYNW